VKRVISKIKFIIPLMALLLLGLLISLPDSIDSGNLFVRNAEAVVGRPATPVSAGGTRRRTHHRTHRRTARRTTRRHIAYGTRVTVVPAGCTTVVVIGTTYYVHEGVYYKPYYEGNTVVYVVVEQPN
jgi:hypothetical protein